MQLDDIGKIFAEELIGAYHFLARSALSFEPSTRKLIASYGRRARCCAEIKREKDTDGNLHSSRTVETGTGASVAPRVSTSHITHLARVHCHVSAARFHVVREAMCYCG